MKSNSYHISNKICVKKGNKDKWHPFVYKTEGSLDNCPDTFGSLQFLQVLNNLKYDGEISTKYALSSHKRLQQKVISSQFSYITSNFTPWISIYGTRTIHLQFIWELVSPSLHVTVYLLTFGNDRNPLCLGLFSALRGLCLTRFQQIFDILATSLLRYKSEDYHILVNVCIHFNIANLPWGFRHSVTLILPALSSRKLLK